MPTYGLYVPDAWAFRSEFESIVKHHYGEKESQYLREVVEKDLLLRRGEKADVPPTVLVDLARDLFGKMGARQMAAATEGVDQPVALAELITSYISSRSEKPKKSTRFSH